MFLSWTKIAVLAAFIVISACGNLPKPFEPSAKDRANPLLQLSDSPGVVVAPVYDAPPELAAPLAESIAEGLRLHDIPATSEEVLNSGNLLEGWYSLADSRAGRVDVVVYWRLSDREGRELLAQESRTRVLLERLARAPALGGAEFVKHIVPAVARTMIGDRPKERWDGDLALILGEISGAPGDGDDALRRAIHAVLRRTEVVVASQTGHTGPRLDAQIEVTAHSDKQDQVRLVWRIRDSEQKTVAVLKQENVLPKGRLDRKWGSLAFDIALAIRPQIVEAVRRLRDPQPHGLAVPPALR